MDPINTIMTMTVEAETYYESLSPKEQHAFDIAKEHLGSLFDVSKTNGFIEWKKKQKSS
jgi:hypothetical protein